MRLRDEVAIVTGATSGIGRAIALRFGAEGARVAVVGRSEDRGAEVVEAIVAAGGSAAFFAADVARESDVARLVTAVNSSLGSPSVLVNNVGLTLPGNVVDLDLATWEKTFSVNVTSVFLLSHHVVPHMLRAGRGSVINISSEAGLKGFRFHDLRHQAITELSEGGASDATMMAVSGHLSKRMLEHYSHVRMAAKRTAIDALGGGLMQPVTVSAPIEGKPS